MGQRGTTFDWKRRGGGKGGDIDTTEKKDVRDKGDGWPKRKIGPFLERITGKGKVLRRKLNWKKEHWEKKSFKLEMAGARRWARACSPDNVLHTRASRHEMS